MNKNLLRVLKNILRPIVIKLQDTHTYRFFKYRIYLNDKVYLKWLFKKRVGYRLELKNPKTFNQKMQWLKLYNRNDFYTKLVDKYEVRNYVEKKIGKEILIPILGVWNEVSEINFDALPDSFVIKCNHDSGGVFLVKDKNEVSKKEIVKFLKSRLKHNSYYASREWPYKNVKKRIFAEKYMVDESGYELKDYKFFCFNGKCELFFVATDRNNDTHFDFYSKEFKHLNIINGHQNTTKQIDKPLGWEKMIQIAETLSENIPFVRVDLYNINGDIFFGEMTMFHYGGLMPFKPHEWDVKLGEYINISEIKR